MVPQLSALSIMKPLSLPDQREPPFPYNFPKYSFHQIDPKYSFQQIDPKYCFQQIDPKYCFQQIDPKYCFQQIEPTGKSSDVLNIQWHFFAKKCPGV